MSVKMHRPHCAKCGKPVSAIDSYYDYVRRAWRFRARCHGEWEITDIPDDMLYDGPVHVESGVAFSQERITAQ